MIRPGCVEDIVTILEFAAPFVRQLPGPPREPEPTFCRQYLARFIDSPHGALFVSETDNAVTGFICGIVTLDPFTGKLITMKSSWIVDPERKGAGLQLLDAFEAWSMKQGAERICSSHLVGGIAVASLLERRGYVRTEIKYERLL